MIRFDNVALRYGEGEAVLHDVSFDLERGSFHFLTGASGAGKTSLLRLIFLAHQPSAGEIFLFDENIGTLPRHRLPFIRRKIGVVFQEFRLLEHLSIYDNVVLPLRAMGEKVKAYHDNALELLSWVGLADKIDAMPPYLSGGEQQRAAIARAVIARPRILLADEPTGNLDNEMGHRLMHLFCELNKGGTTIVIATHDETLWHNFSYPRLHVQQGQINIHPAHQ